FEQIYTLCNAWASDPSPCTDRLRAKVVAPGMLSCNIIFNEPVLRTDISSQGRRNSQQRYTVIAKTAIAVERWFAFCRTESISPPYTFDLSMYGNDESARKATRTFLSLAFGAETHTDTGEL
ncbi:hypothetical protein LTR95_005918, partial [Oleoguttula sp. CCFEE 5521]